MARRKTTVLHDALVLLETLRRIGNLDRRKLGLFGVACCRRVWHLMTQPESRDMVLLVERALDRRAGLAGAKAKADLQAAGEWAAAAVDRLTRARAPAEAVAAAQAARYAGDPRGAVGYAAAAAGGPQGAEAGARAALLVDVHGNPLWHVDLDPGLRTDTVVAVARAAYDERLPSLGLDPHRLAVLSDALEEAGCTDTDLLSHLRSPGPHVRGCWPVDLCLGPG